MLNFVWSSELVILLRSAGMWNFRCTSPVIIPNDTQCSKPIIPPCLSQSSVSRGSIAYSPLFLKFFWTCKFAWLVSLASSLMRVWRLLHPTQLGLMINSSLPYPQCQNHRKNNNFVVNFFPEQQRIFPWKDKPMWADFEKTWSSITLDMTKKWVFIWWNAFGI